jgi:ABC-type nitrate/sulfonate/bicarbonate transport system, permease component
MPSHPMFKLRGDLSGRHEFVLGIIGAVIFVLLWWVLAEAFSKQRAVFDDDITITDSYAGIDDPAVRDSIAALDSMRYASATNFEKVYPLLPTPLSVLKSFPSLISQDELLPNALKSIWLNVQGYVWAILIAVPIGFLIGLFPIFRGLFSRQVDAMRFLPLTALTGLFIIWFGIEDKMKVAFLAFGIIVYLLPVVVQRIWEVRDVYLKTVFTIGATDWHTIRTVYIPSVMSKLIEDIRVLTAISWTYIIIAELVNRTGGIGSLIYIKERQGQIPKVFAILIVFIIIGFLQDIIFVFISKRLFPHKHHSSYFTGLKESRFGVSAILLLLLIAVLVNGLWGMSSTILLILAAVIFISAFLFTLYGEYLIFKAVEK